MAAYENLLSITLNLFEINIIISFFPLSSSNSSHFLKFTIYKQLGKTVSPTFSIS